MLTPKRIVLVGADYPELEKYCPNFNGMRAGLDRLKIKYLFLSCRHPKKESKLDIDALVAFNPDLVIYALRDVILQPKWRQEVRDRLPGVPIVMWYGDFRNTETTQYDANCSTTIDAMFVSNDAQEMFYQQKWKMPKVMFLPLGCEPIAKPKIQPMYKFDFVFIGGSVTSSPFNDRAAEILRFKIDADLTIINSFEPAMRARIMKAMPEIYSTSKISLDVSHFTDVMRYTSNRYWIIPAFWGFPLTKRFPGCEEFYPEDARAYFSTFEEAVEKKNYYLKNDGERDYLIKKMRTHVGRHTYDVRFRKMFEML